MTEEIYKKYSKMTEGELRMELFDLIKHLIGDENAYKIDGTITGQIKTLFKAYANSATKRIQEELNDARNMLQDRLKGDGRVSTGEGVDYPKCPTCGEDVFSQAYVGSSLKEMYLYCSNTDCATVYRVRFIDLKRKVV